MRTPSSRTWRLFLAAVVLLNVSCGGDSGGGTSSNPTPTLTELSRDTATVGITPFQLGILGADFKSGAVASFDGAARTTTYLTGGWIKIQLIAADLSAVGDHTITVENPDPSDGASAPLTFTVLAEPPAPTLDSIAPGTVAANGPAFVLHAYGTGFAPATVIRWNGNAVTTTWISATHLTAAIPADAIVTPGAIGIRVFTQAPGGGASAQKTLTITP